MLKYEKQQVRWDDTCSHLLSSCLSRHVESRSDFQVIVTSVLRVCTDNVQLDNYGDPLLDEKPYCLQHVTMLEPVHVLKNMRSMFHHPCPLQYYRFYFESPRF